MKRRLYLGRRTAHYRKPRKQREAEKKQAAEIEQIAVEIARRNEAEQMTEEEIIRHEAEQKADEDRISHDIWGAEEDRMYEEQIGDDH